MKNKATLSEVLSRLGIEINNLQEFLNKLQQLLDTKSDSVTLQQTLNDGTQTTFTVPSFGFLQGKVEELQNQFESLISTNDDVIGVKLQDGTTRKFELQKLASIIQDLESINDSTLEVPTEFRVKNNWFFESLLNPLIFVSLDVSTIVTDDIDQFAVKRIIVTSNDDDSLTYFDENLKGQNDLTISDVRTTLEQQNIEFFEDDDVVDMPRSINRFRGTFDVLKVFEEEIIDTTTGENVSVVRRKYKLDSLTYTDVLGEEEKTVFLAEGDNLITNNDGEYAVISVDKTEKTVVLERRFGIDSITLGADVLRVRPEAFRIPELQVNVGFDEREIIFIRPISKKTNLTTDQFSNGFAIYTNDLTIELEDGAQVNFQQYYNNFVSDFGLLFMNFAKEKKVPATIGETPDAPVLDLTSFQVVQKDLHIKEDENVLNLKQKIASKEKLASEVTEIDKKIEKLKNTLNSAATAVNASERSRIKKDIEAQSKIKTNTLNQLSTTVKDLTLQVKTVPEFIVPEQYVVRGFWPIPDALETQHGLQNIIQFRVQYRKLSRKGTAPNATQNKFNDTDGAERTAFFSPWEEVMTCARKKVLNEETGLYEFTIEDISNPDVVNTNQIEIPIRKGEIVEIRVKSVSEAGYPENPVESDWSNTVQVEFPTDIESTEESRFISQQLFAEESRIAFQEELNARQLDLHLLNSFTTGDKYFSHQASDIASGQFTNEGNVIDVSQWIANTNATIESILTSIQTAKGEIKVTIFDESGNAIDVNNGETVPLFAGFYRDLIKDTSSGATVFNEGQIVTARYTVSIQNTSQTILELISNLFGGIDEVPETSDPLTYPNSDYHVNRRYDVTPLAAVENIIPTELQGIKQPPSNQSSQVKSQFAYMRYKEFGLANNIYADFFNQTSYDYEGQDVSGTTVPYNWGHYLPYNPIFDGSTTSFGTFGTNVNVWNGSVTSGTPNGSGYLSEFCLHIDHPELKNLGTTYSIVSTADAIELFRPEFPETGGDINGTQQYLPFVHGLHFETGTNERTNVFGALNTQQAIYKTPEDIPSLDNNDRLDNNYPIKLGFVPNDEFLIGKYTCGAYFFIFPQKYSDISVEGNNPLQSTREVEFGEEKSINIPLIFQFRCSDKLGNVGGFRNDETLRNITYTKKLGFDIYIKDQIPFSFDVEASASYQKETTLDAPIVPSRGRISINLGG